jgi:hypothetical protein
MQQYRDGTRFLLKIDTYNCFGTERTLIMTTRSATVAYH